MQDKDLQIFKNIVDIITQSEFVSAQEEFMKKNCETFEDTEENKLEYTNVYTEYVHILDQMIDAQLKTTYQDAELESFYVGFKDNMPQYEKINPEVVDNLFGFLDFDKFKKAMLSFKNQGNEDYAKDEYSTDDSDQKVDQTEDLWNEFIAEDVNDPSTGWRKSLERPLTDGVQSSCWQRPVPGQPLNMVKQVGVLKNVSWDALQIVGKEFDKYWKYWDTQNTWVCCDTVEQRLDPTEAFVEYRLLYMRFKMGMMASDRDLVLTTTVKKIADNKWLSFQKSSLDGSQYPLNDKCVRMYCFVCQLYEQVGDDVHITEFRQMDLNGYFPKSMMNKVMSVSAQDSMLSTYKTMQLVKKQLEGN